MNSFGGASCDTKCTLYTLPTYSGTKFSQFNVLIRQTFGMLSSSEILFRLGAPGKFENFVNSIRPLPPARFVRP